MPRVLEKNSDSGEVGEETTEAPMRCISVVIADRHPVVLQGLTSVLRPESGFKVVASCSDGRNCIEAIRSLVPDIAIPYISLPNLTALTILTTPNSHAPP